VETTAGQHGRRERNIGDHATVATWFCKLTPDELETLCELLDRVLAEVR
jgi:hypothetical protein